jgi:group I intron endonuclease
VPILRHPLTDVYAIYAIVNIVTGDVYIGSTDSLSVRFTRHRHGLRHGVHHSVYLQRAYIKYGPDSFRFVVCERTERNEDHLLEREQHWIDMVKPTYNMSKTAGRICLSREARMKIGEKNAKHYIVTKPDGTEIEVHNLTRFCRENGLEYAQLGQVVRGRQGQHRGWKARRKDNPKPEYSYYQPVQHVFIRDDKKYYVNDLKAFARQHGRCEKTFRHLIKGKISSLSGFRYVETIRS